MFWGQHHLRKHPCIPFLEMNKHDKKWVPSKIRQHLHSWELTYPIFNVTFEDGFPNFPRWDMFVPWRVTTGNEINEASSSPNDFQVIYVIVLGRVVHRFQLAVLIPHISRHATCEIGKSFVLQVEVYDFNFNILINSEIVKCFSLPVKIIFTISARWAPTSYKLSYNSFK